MNRGETLARALEVAEQVALEAGRRLRDEFFRPGGPRGWADKADIDEEVEVFIRGALLQAFPDWSFQGEETGKLDGGGTVCWVVDPNDGTRCFLKGERGSSVSIGVLWDCQPVLGVVYSPLYPDNQGDLLTWAEGCGPLRRNGAALDQPHWPGQLTTEHTVLVSQSGDRATSANLRCCKPARFRCMPSVAYRFALVAAGEGVAGVSLAGPVAHDLVACHALIRGQGGVLLDQDAQLLVYDRSGYCSNSSCFGGGSAVCAELTGRPWRVVHKGGPAEAAGFLFPIREKTGAGVADDRLWARGLGCWLGQLAGDSLGSLVEFRRPEAIAESYPTGPSRLADGGTWGTLAGQPTDDSELALCLARTLVAREGYDRQETWRAYRVWGQSHPFDIGMTTSKALLFYDEAPEAGRESDSQANGALMRCCPLALAGWSRVEQVLRWSDEDASITHPHPICLAANRAFLRGVVAGLQGAEPDQMWEQAVQGSEGEVRAALERARREPPADFMHHMGWVLLALQNAFYRVLHAPSLEQGVVETVRSGGDTDTNACIAGALLGSYHGVRHIPQQWRTAILSCRPSWDFKASQPRPAFCWPVDALQLVERLLWLGR